MPTGVFGRLRRFWRDKVASPSLRTYDAAVEELGGQPWRARPEATDRWFLPDRTAPVVRPPSVETRAFDTGAVDLRPRMSLPTKLVILIAAFALGAGIVSAALHLQ
ncbi:MAG TPA: hypothetical protein VN947_19180 [Polyangia bacterium]|nr:hypothetical protein [Polyangia bacterium]